MGGRLNINLREPSTKRGIAMIITGCTVLYQTIWGSGQMNIDALFSRVDWWLGVGLNIVGMFGLLPDSPPRNPQERTRATDLPKIELQGHSESVTESRNGDAADQPERVPPADRRLRLDVPPGHRTQPESDERGSDESWHGFNDR